MIAPVPPDPEPIYTGTSVCYAPGYTPPAQYLAGPEAVVLVVIAGAVLAASILAIANQWPRYRARWHGRRVVRRALQQ